MADYTLLGSLTGPGSNDGDATQINLALLFKVTSTCWVKALRFWRADTGIGGTPSGQLYTYIDESSGTAVTGTDVTFVLSGTGWQQANLATPVQLSSGQLYKVVVNFPSFYAATGGYFATGAGVGGIVSGPLTAPDAGGTPLGIGSVKQGTFATGGALAYPTSYFNGGNYWVDALVTDVDPSSTPLTVTDTATGARGVGPAEQLQIGLTAIDTATSASAATPAETILIGLTHTDTAGSARTVGQPGTLAADLLHADTATGARAGTTPGVLVIDVIHADTANAGRANGGTDALSADLLHADRAVAARAVAPSPSLLIQADVVLVDAAAACRAGITAGTLHLGTAYTWPPHGGTVAVQRTAIGAVSIQRVATGTVAII